MKKIILLILTLLLTINVVFSATYYVKDPNDCPTTDGTNFPGQDCSPDDICGDISGVAQCYDTSGISIPTEYNAGYQSSVNSALAEGYVLNCYASTTCVDAWSCDRNSTCYSTQHRSTICNSTTVTMCDDCLSGYNDCDNDGLICEIHNGDACTVGSLSGTYSGCDGSVGNCVVSTSHHITGSEANYSSSSPNLWSHQWGSGVIANFTNATNSSLLIDELACLIFPDLSQQCTAATGDSYDDDWINLTFYTMIDIDALITGNLSLAYANDTYQHSDIFLAMTGNLSLAYANDSSTEYDDVWINTTFDNLITKNLSVAYANDTYGHSDIFTLIEGNLSLAYANDTPRNCSVEGSCPDITYDNELDYYTDSDIGGDESAFDGWDKDTSDDAPDLTTNVSAHNATILSNINYIQALQANITNNATKLDTTNESLQNLIDAEGTYLTPTNYTALNFSIEQVRTRLQANATKIDTTNTSLETLIGLALTSESDPVWDGNSTLVAYLAEFEGNITELQANISTHNESIQNILDDYLTSANEYIDADAISAINVTKAFYNISINCSNIWFDNGILGSSDICDGGDSTGEGGAVTGSGTSGLMAKWTAETELGNAAFSENAIIGNHTLIKVVEGNLTNNASKIDITNNSVQNILNDYLTSADVDLSTYLENETVSNFSKIYSSDWSNVTVTESQVTDLNHYTDSDIDGSESAFDGWDKNAGDDYSDSDIGGDESAFDGWDKDASDDAPDLTTNVSTHNATILSNINYIQALQTNITNNATKLDTTNESVQNLIDAENEYLTPTNYTALNFSIEQVRTRLQANATKLDTTNTSLEALITLDADDWDAIGDVPTATPSDGDSSNLATGDQIYDWVTGLGYLSSEVDSVWDGNSTLVCYLDEFEGNVTELQGNISTHNATILSNINYIQALSANITNNATKLDTTNTSVETILGDYLTSTNYTSLNSSIETRLENSTHVVFQNVTLSTDTTNHFIYDDADCIIIQGDTATLKIC